MKNTNLFLDDRHLNIIVDAKRAMHPAAPLTNVLYIDPAVDVVSLAWGYPFVYFHPDLKKTIMLYQGWSLKRAIIANTLSLAAISDDGINFKPLDMRGIAIGESRILFNQVLPYRLGEFVFAEGQFFHLPELASTRKFIALCIYKGVGNIFKAYVFTSADGLAYSFEPGITWHEGNDAPDYPLSVIYEPIKREFLIYRRPRHTDRRIAVARTGDFRSFTGAELILQSDALDHPLTDFYGMTAFRYADYVIGLLMIYETPNYLIKNGKRVSDLPGHKFDGGPVIPQLVYATDGSHFLRGQRKAIIDNSRYPCAYPTCVMVTDGAVRVYASVTREEHGRVAPGLGGIAIFKWRKDGFISMRFPAGGGLVVTRQLLYRGGPISFNIDAAHGRAFIQIGNDDNQPMDGFLFDDCLPFFKDGEAHEFTFKQHMIEELAGQVIVISVSATNADLFAISGDIEWLTPYQAMMIRQEKTPT